ncbi:zinc finger CCCH domain-containing protein 53-like isoform X1 [Papaver somniferum]|uniref:zinc finger CCCH domain-containing protein 53-like isoform X1 n=1 Tax=Papaver somniferum TaxID=3469 RepID=UPI000E7017FA|nr:zinc finger CCCH domain-containing protein 53-like isoform X1 [Papaver somniferum]
MDAYEATRIVFSRIQTLDPENASKIMGLLLIKDHGEKEMIRLAFGPESLLHSLIIKARTELGISSNTCSTPSTPSSPSPFFSSSNPNSLSRQNSSSFSSSNSSTATTTTSNTIPISTNNNTTSSTSIATSRMLSNLSLPNPSSWGSSVPSSYSDFQNSDDFLISPNSSSSLSYAAAMNGFSNSNMNLGSSADLIDDFQLQEQLSFLNEKNNNDFFYPSLEQVSSPSSNSDGMLFPNYAANWGNAANNSAAAAMSNGSHRRSCSVTDICLGSDPLGSGFGWKPCLYYNRGYCKNGTTCRFLHGDSPDSPSMVGSPSKIDFMEQCQELLRSKAAQQQQQQQQMRLNTASQLLGTSSLPYTSVAGKCMNFLLQQQQNDNQRAAAAALLLGEDMKFGRNRMERSEFSSSGGGMINPGSRQIYLTFPADSTFREEDVSNYFSIYGPVQDVRIPYQQKRMFGFVTFVYPETVKLILAKGNPHFVCDARVLVKPYKEKGKVPDNSSSVINRKQQNQGERGEYSSCTTPTGLDSRDPYDLQQLGGARMLYNNQDLLLRRKLEEQAELQQAIDMQSRRLMGLQLLDIKKHHHRNLSMGAVPIPSPTHSHAFLNQTLINSMSSPRSSETREENCGSPAAATSPGSDQLGGDQHSQQLAVNMDAKKEELVFVDNITEEKPNGESEVHEGSSEHNLPDSPFASGGDSSSFFSTDTAEAERSIAASSAFSSSLSSPSSIHSNVLASSLFPPTSTLDMASFKSCFFPMPRFSSGQGAIEM